MPDPATSHHDLADVLEQYRARIHRYVNSLVRESAEAEDITQETLLRAYRNLAALQDRSKLSPWLYRIATNLSYDRFRQVSTRPRLESLEDVPEGTGGPGAGAEADLNSPSLDKVMEQSEMSACVQGYLEALSDSYRAVILLHDVEGLSNPEIAEMLGCSLATVKIGLHRARARLKATLARGCDFSCDDRGVLICEPKSGAADQDPE